MASATSLTKYLDEQPVRRSHVGVLILFTFLLMLDGIDLQLLALSSPVIVDEWGISGSQFAPALSAALIGMAIGTAAGGWMGDRWSLRNVILASVVLFGLATLATSQAWDVRSMAAIRFVAGLGFGAMAPCLYAVAGEIFPGKFRPKVMATLAIGIPAGGILGSALALVLIRHIGWSGCFVVAGALTLVAFAIAVRTLPGSPSQMLLMGRTATAQKAVAAITGSTDLSWSRVNESTTSQAIAVRPDSLGTLARLFNSTNRRLTIGAILGFSGFGFVAYGFLSWQPVLLSSQGLPVETAVQASLVLNILSTIGCLLVAVLHTRFGSKRTLVVAAALLCVTILTMYLTIPSAVSTGSWALLLLFVGVGIAGLCAGYTNSTYLAIVAQGYDAQCRGSGVGFTSVSSRIMAIVVTLTGGMLLAFASRGAAFFTMMGVMASLIFVGALVVDRHVKKTNGRDSAAPSGTSNGNRNGLEHEAVT